MFYFIGVHLAFDVNKTCGRASGGLPDCEIKFVQAEYVRVAFLGGDDYKKMADNEIQTLVGFINKYHAVPIYSQNTINEINKELKSIFWWAWWLKGEHILKCYWYQCVFSSFDKQTFTKIHPVYLKILYLQDNPRNSVLQTAHLYYRK